MAEPARGSVYSLLIVGAMLLLQSVPAAAGEPYPAEPAALFRHLCAACHGLRGDGDGPNAEHLDPRPADLTDPEYMATATEQDLFKVIEAGGRALEITPAMPAWGRTLSRAQIKGLVAYVQSLSRTAAPPGKLPVSRQGLGRGPGDTARCLTCHAMRGESRPIAPDLAAAGSKLRRDWLFAFLRNPPRIRPVGYLPLTKSRMPNFQFTEAEAGAVTDYLMTKKDPMIARAGSSPAQAIGEVRVTPELAARGRRLFEEEYACDACHRVGERGGIVGPDLTGAGRRLQPQWIIQWLKRPQAIRSDSPMPNLGLSDSEARSLMAYLLSLEAARPPGPAGAAPFPEPASVKKGETLVKEKNCLGCHTLGSSVIRRG